MKLAAQIVGIVVLFLLAGMLNACNNQSKHDRCVDNGGRFVLNDTNSSRSYCMMEN